MEDTTKKILNLKDALDKAKNEYYKLSGQLDNLNESLKKDWGVSDLKEANQKLSDLVMEQESIESKINSVLPGIEEALKPWM